MGNHGNQMMHQRGNQMVNEHGYDAFDRMMEQPQDSNQREYMRRQDGRMNNVYSYERMLQRQNEARRNMNNRQMMDSRFDNNQHRMFKREAESSFEYDVTAEHDNNQVSRNQQMMDVMIRPEQTYQIDNRMNNYMNQRNSQHMQYNMDNRMDGRMNRNNQMMHQRNNQMMHQRNNQIINQHNQHNRYQMDTRRNQMESRRNQMDSRMNQMDSRRNQMDSRMYQMDAHRNHMDQYNMNNQMNNQMTNQMHQGQRQFGDNTFGFDRASMQYQNRQFQQQDQFRNYY